MSSFYQDVAETVDGVMVDPKDFKRYHTNVIKDNERAFVSAVKKLNNAKYKKFEDEVLLPRCNKDGKIKSGVAARLWILFEDSHEVLATVKVHEHLRQISEDEAKYWIKEFDRPIEELWEYGVNAISSAYGLLLEYFRQRMVREKYERVYSQGSTFEEWYDLADKNWALMSGEELPFDIGKVGEKAKTIIAVRI